MVNCIVKAPETLTFSIAKLEVNLQKGKLRNYNKKQVLRLLLVKKYVNDIWTINFLW